MCSNDPSKKRKFWESFKKSLPIIISIVSGIIISSITAYIILITGAPRPKLTAKAYYENWRTPRVATEDLTDLEGARSQFKKKDPNDRSLLKTDHNDLKTTWEMLDGEPNYSATDINDMLCMCSITISNKGGAPAKEVKMYFPDASHVEFAVGGIPEKEFKESNNKIFYVLDKELSQEDNIEVRVWTKCTPNRECADKLSIACEKDRASICVRIPVRGYAQYMSYYPGWTIFLIVIIWFVIHAGVWIKRRTNQPGTG